MFCPGKTKYLCGFMRSKKSSYLTKMPKSMLTDEKGAKSDLNTLYLHHV